MSEQPTDAVFHYTGGEWIQLPWPFTPEQEVAIRVIVRQELAALSDQPKQSQPHPTLPAETPPHSM
jgi:hypothetical protein